MEREIFKSHPLRGIPIGLVRGFMYGCLILLVSLALGMNEDLFIPLLVVFVILCGIIGMISSIGKSITADGNGIYVKNKAYLFAENNMYMQVHTHYYNCIPVTERWIDIVGKDGKHKVKCSFLNGQDAGRLAKIIEDGMKKKSYTPYDGFERNDADVQIFIIPAAELKETIDKRGRLLVNIMFWFLTVVFSWVLISMIIQDQLEEYGIWLVIALIMNVLILGGVTFFITRKFKKSARKIPYEIVFRGGIVYIDGKPFAGMDVRKVVMTPERGDAKGDMRRMLLYDRTEKTSEYSFGFRADEKGYPGYAQLVEAVKDHFGDKFAYDFH